MAYQPPTVNLDSSMLAEGPYTSYFNTKRASINDELKTIKVLFYFLSTAQINADTSESVIDQQASTRER